MPVSISVWRAGIANSGAPFISFRLKSGKIQLSGLTNQILFCFLYIYLLIFVSVFTVPVSLLLNFVFLPIVTLTSSCYTRPPSPDMDTLVGLLHTYVSLTLYNQATLLFANPLVQFLKSRIVSFFTDLSDVRYALNLLVRLLHDLMTFMLMEYLNCTNYVLSELLLRLAGNIHPNRPPPPGPVKKG